MAASVSDQNTIDHPVGESSPGGFVYLDIDFSEYLGIARDMDSIMRAHDPYTAKHQRRVAILASDIGREYGLGELRRTTLRIAGMIHDLGKVAISPDLLNRTGFLTPMSMATLRRHAKDGSEMATELGFPQPVLLSVHQHHERLDGSGYPNGLVGDQISLEARILAVADVVDAMAFTRPYRPAKGVDAALAEVQRCGGALFDAEVVRCCVQVMSKRRSEGR